MDPMIRWQDSLPFVLWETQQAVHRVVQNEIADLGVTITQLGLVVHLDEHGRMSASDLARRFRLAPQSVTTALGRLEEQDWVRRIPHPVHRKVIWYELTETGASRVDDARERMQRVTMHIDALVSEKSRGDLTRLLHDLDVALEGAPPYDGPMWPLRG